jgi:anion-transporting  ArsA/GET3 family ATPase
LRPLHYVTGKGGVGKSVVAAALAFDLARRGARVLAIELDGPGGLARILAGTEVPFETFDGTAAFGEYLTRRMHLGRLARLALANPLYRAFVEAAPGLGELLVIGKVRDELVLRGHRWDAVVVDAGASGHALEHLRMPAAAARAFGSGRVHREAAANAALLRDPSTCAVHVVALPEEMPLREGAQIVGALRALELPLGAVIVNQCRPVAPPGIDDVIAVVGSPLDRVARRARSWERIQERGIAALEAEVGVRAARLPRVWTGDATALARALAAPVAEAVA